MSQFPEEGVAAQTGPSPLPGALSWATLATGGVLCRRSLSRACPLSSQPCWVASPYSAGRLRSAESPRVPKGRNVGLLLDEWLLEPGMSGLCVRAGLEGRAPAGRTSGPGFVSTARLHTPFLPH